MTKHVVGWLLGIPAIVLSFCISSSANKGDTHEYLKPTGQE